jgi:NTE family protein
MKEKAKIGLSLSGGAMRGLAHIGVLEVLEENSIPIDMIAGTSMGSVVGAIYASGMRLSLMRGFCEKITLAESRKFFDLSIPKMGMIRGERIQRLLYTLTGGKNIEDFNIPYVAAACCIEDASTVYYTKGSAVEAMRASIAIPGVFDPVVKEGKTYVDGGVLERSPVQILKDMGADYIICSDVNYRGGANKTPKNLFSMLFTVYDMMEWQAMSQRVSSADISIISDTRDISPATFTQAKKCMDIGRDSALEHVDEIKMALAILDKSI